MEIIALKKKKIANGFRTVSAESGGSRTFLECDVPFIAKKKKSKFPLHVSIGERKKFWTQQLKYTVVLAIGQLMETGIPIYVHKL